VTVAEIRDCFLKRRLGGVDREFPQVRLQVHGDPVAYRRDRRKDFALQEAGYIVLRWLAEDVAKSLEEILARVRRAMEIQKQRWAKETEQ